MFGRDLEEASFRYRIHLLGQRRLSKGGLYKGFSDGVPAILEDGACVIFDSLVFGIQKQKDGNDFLRPHLVMRRFFCIGRFRQNIRETERSIDILGGQPFQRAYVQQFPCIALE